MNHLVCFRSVIVAAMSCVILHSAFAQDFIFDDFNRADGPVGSGWGSWWNHTQNSSEIRIESGQLRTLGAPTQAGGIFRHLGVTFPLTFSFDFRTTAPPDGGWDIRFNGDFVGDFPNQTAYDPAQVRFYQFSGGRDVSRRYLDSSNNEVTETRYFAGQRDFRSDVMATITGTVWQDLSAVITIVYHDGQQPPSATYVWGPAANPAQTPPSDYLILQNSNATAGPHFFDNLRVTRGTASTIYPDSFSIFRGILFSGALSDLLNDDQQYLVVYPGMTAFAGDYPVSVIVNGTAPTSNPSELKFKLDAKAQINGIGQTIELFDYVGNGYVTVDSRQATTTDQSVEITTTNPSRFVDPITNHVQARIKYKAIGIIALSRWAIGIDQAIWTTRL